MDFREMAEKTYQKLIDPKTATTDLDPTYFIESALRAAYSQGVSDSADVMWTGYNGGLNPLEINKAILALKPPSEKI